MEPIAKENEFVRINLGKEAVTSVVKSKFIKRFYYYEFFSNTEIQRTASTTELKKMRIQSTKPILFVFILFAAIFIGAGYGYSIEGGSGNLVTGLILAIITLFGAFLFQRSKAGNLKVMWTYVKGSIFVIYASLDVAELQALRRTIEDGNQ